MKLTLFLGLTLLVACASSVRAQQPISTDKPPIKPYVSVQWKPLPVGLKQQLQHRIILSCGMTSFGKQANPIWATTVMGTVLGRNDTLEFWQQEKGNSFRLLRRVFLPPMQDQHLSTRSLSESIELRWLDPTKRRGPVIIANMANETIVIYTFATGWQDRHPIVQKIEPIDVSKFDFDSVDARGILWGETWVSFHQSTPEDPAGDTYRASWATGKGWIESDQSEFYPYLPELIPHE